MRLETVLLRQVNPRFIQNGRFSSQVFRPTPKDHELLSVDNGDLITPEASFFLSLVWRIGRVSKRMLRLQLANHRRRRALPRALLD
jgi:hypothetical protein